MRLRIFALALVVTLAGPAGASAKPILGFNDAPQTFIEHAAAVEAAGATLARVPVNWAMTESIAPSLLRWDELDQTVSALRTHQVTPMFVIFSAPKSAAGGCEPEPDPPATCGVAPGHTDAYVQFAVALLERYPGSLVQTWNEPDLEMFGGMSPGRVAELTNALVAVAPGLVVGAAEAPVDTHALRYTKRAYRLTDPSVPMALHLYPRSPIHANGYRGAWRRAQELARKRPLWVTEVGYASSSYGARGQASALASTYRFLAREGAAAIIVHRLRDSEIQANPWLSSLGLLRENGSPKPAFEALRAAAAAGR